ncbi:UPF0291 protein [Jeotgalicoccus coquinae]|uniref:UPF0291 protein HNR41_000651 n=1 Tax=Jeotgalicoccus coquinae TaxID=709509 RepID=A0A6V7RCH6_9STAP|nr:DUF896 domain-containing protein [Jeotgalicoccus coquinae]MBB6422725.1 uncharacterized protein YnzC (UPF0291/DUF896 family) [Jeotgalicoccus coquinae]GGE13618.1 UPF0291 protein [Jeotgalicoccus coquinae]CAD2074484.1 hypothetical protein JEOCOQ751_00954 [Jeotgalicoccus coquinae]
MLDDQKLKRLNQLAKLKREDKISETELKELAGLREEYLSNFRNTFKNQIKNTKVIDPEGKDVTPDKIKALRNKK